jgi:hypothetical protein
MRLTVDVDEKMLQDVQTRLGDLHKKAPNAISGALNRAIANVNTNIGKEIRKEYVIKAGDIKETITVSKASRAKLSATARSKGNLIGLDKFKVSPKTINPNRKSSIKIGVKKSGVKQVMGAFVADLGGVKVFKRKDKDRLPIQRLFGPSVPQMLANEDIRAEIEKQGQETFDQRLEHEINRIIERGK